LALFLQERIHKGPSSIALAFQKLEVLRGRKTGTMTKAVEPKTVMGVG